MTLAVERYDSPLRLGIERHEAHTLWLVLLDPNGPSKKLALFTDPGAVSIWKDAHNAAMLMSREVGRSGL